MRAERGQGTLVAVGFPAAALLGVALRVGLHGAGIGSGIAAAVVLVFLTALATGISVVVAPRTSVSVPGPFLVAAAPVGGPLVGVCAEAATPDLTVRDVWRTR